jgi:hypothetical protein
LVRERARETQDRLVEHRLVRLRRLGREDTRKGVADVLKYGV